MDALTYNSLTKLNNQSSFPVAQMRTHGKRIYSLSIKFEPQHNVADQDSVKVKQLLQEHNKLGE